MLVLSRFKNEDVIIGKAGDVLTEPIVITVVEVRGNKVRIGIKADKSMSVHRKEVQDAINKENM